MNKHILSGFYITPLILSLISCKPDLNQAEKRWEKNLKRISYQKARYPVFRPILNQVLSKALVLKKQIPLIKDPDKKIETLIRANNRLENKFTKALDIYQNKLIFIKKQQRKIRSLRISARKRKTLNNDLKAARKAVWGVRKKISNADGKSHKNALKTIREANRILLLTSRSLNRTYMTFEVEKKK